MAESFARPHSFPEHPGSTPCPGPLLPLPFCLLLRQSCDSHWHANQHISTHQTAGQAAPAQCAVRCYLCVLYACLRSGSRERKRKTVCIRFFAHPPLAHSSSFPAPARASAAGQHAPRRAVCHHPTLQLVGVFSLRLLSLGSLVPWVPASVDRVIGRYRRRTQMIDDRQAWGTEPHAIRLDT